MKKWAGFNVLSFGRTDTCCERERESVSCRRQRAIAGPQTPDGVGVVGLGAYSGQGAWNSVEAQRGDSIPCCQLGMHLVHRNTDHSSRNGSSPQHERYGIPMPTAQRVISAEKP